jgi:hypothetical protein
VPAAGRYGAVQKVSFVAKVGDQLCGVEYYK